jgi:hypothetical protein
MTDAQRAKKWLNNHGYEVTEQGGHSQQVFPDGFFFVAPKEDKTREDGKPIQDDWHTLRGTELLAFARSKGWRGEG